MVDGASYWRGPQVTLRDPADRAPVTLISVIAPARVRPLHHDRGPAHTRRRPRFYVYLNSFRTSSSVRRRVVADPAAIVLAFTVVQMLLTAERDMSAGIRARGARDARLPEPLSRLWDGRRNTSGGHCLPCARHATPLVLSILASLKSTAEAGHSPRRTSRVDHPRRYERLDLPGRSATYLGNSFGTAFLTIASSLG